MSDEFSWAGLRVPTLSEPTLEKMAEFFQLVGASYFNPVDIGGINRSNLETILDLLTGDPNVDVIAMMRSVQRGRRSAEDIAAELKQYGEARDKSGKPMMAMFWTPVPYPDHEPMEETDAILRDLGIPTFPSPSRAARALRKVVDYHRFHAGMDG